MERLRKMLEERGVSYATYEETTLIPPLTLSLYEPAFTAQATLESWQPDGHTAGPQIPLCTGESSCLLFSSRSKRPAAKSASPTPWRQVQVNATVQGFTLTRTGKLYYFAGGVSGATMNATSFKTGTVIYPRPTDESVSSFPSGPAVSRTTNVGGPVYGTTWTTSGFAGEMGVTTDPEPGTSWSVTFGMEIGS